jgi:enamine deaminase RidA (YjgF/YER057c/UK114 family)
MRIHTIHPPGWAQPKGYSNGLLVDGAGQLLFVAGQIAWDEAQRLVGEGDFQAQFLQALKNVVTIVREAGGVPEHLVRVRVYVTDKKLYLDRLDAVGAAWRELVGRHWPAMVLVEVADLLEEGALVEIEAMAALP